MADTSRVEEIPPKEPLFNAVPLKSALKKRPAPSASPAGTPLATPLQPRQDHHHASFKSVSNVTISLIHIKHTTTCGYENIQFWSPLLINCPYIVEAIVLKVVNDHWLTELRLNKAGCIDLLVL